jgi:hypothetical protein
MTFGLLAVRLSRELKHVTPPTLHRAEAPLNEERDPAF